MKYTETARVWERGEMSLDEWEKVLRKYATCDCRIKTRKRIPERALGFVYNLDRHYTETIQIRSTFKLARHPYVWCGYSKYIEYDDQQSYRAEEITNLTRPYSIDGIQVFKASECEPRLGDKCHVYQKSKKHINPGRTITGNVEVPTTYPVLKTGLGYGERIHDGDIFWEVE